MVGFYVAFPDMPRRSLVSPSDPWGHGAVRSAARWSPRMSATSGVPVRGGGRIAQAAERRHGAVEFERLIRKLPGSVGTLYLWGQGEPFSPRISSIWSGWHLSGISDDHLDERAFSRRCRRYCRKRSRYAHRFTRRRYAGNLCSLSGRRRFPKGRGWCPRAANEIRRRGRGPRS